MRNFVLGVVVTMVVIVVGIASYLMLGLVQTNADASPSRLEMRMAMSALDASIDRHAPHLTNPAPPTDDNLIAGIKIYTMNCAGCHGGLDNKPSPLENHFYPPAPQVILNPMDDPEWHIFYAIRTGVRYSAMPAWSKILSEEDMWKVTAFLSHLEKLPPRVQEYWKKSVGTGPAAHSESEENHSH